VYDVAMAAIFDIQPLHLFFTAGEWAVFKNMASWWSLFSDADEEEKKEFKEGWYTLPGPACWWPDDYDFDGNGFSLPDEDMRYEEVFSLVFDTTYKKTRVVPPI
jgi:hypothetical protein